MYRAGLDAPPAPDTERFFPYRIRLDLCRAQDGREPDAGPEFRCQEHIVCAEIPEACEKRGMAMGEEGEELEEEVSYEETVPAVKVPAPTPVSIGAPAPARCGVVGRCRNCGV